MKKLLKTAVFTLCLAMLPHAATVPAQNLSPFSLGAEYYGVLHGHEALQNFDSSGIAAHFLRLHYSPLPFLRLSGGFGGSHLYASPLRDGAKVDIAFTGGFGLYWIKPLDYLSLTAGYDGYYLNAAEKYDRNVYADGDAAAYRFRERSGGTSAALHAPYLGLILHAGRFVDFEVGGLYHHFTILKRTQSTHTLIGLDPVTGQIVQETVRAPEIKDALADQARIYGTLTFHERESGAYLSGGVSYALTNQADGDNLQNLSAWAQVGLIMRERRESARGVRYSETYHDLKRRQSRIAAQLQDDSSGRPQRGPRAHGPRDSRNGEGEDVTSTAVEE